MTTKKGRVSRFHGTTVRKPEIIHHGKSTECSDKIQRALEYNDDLSNQLIITTPRRTTFEEKPKENKVKHKRKPNRKRKKWAAQPEVDLNAEVDVLNTVFSEVEDFELKTEFVPREKEQFVLKASKYSSNTRSPNNEESNGQMSFWEDTNTDNEQKYAPPNETSWGNSQPIFINTSTPITADQHQPAPRPPPVANSAIDPINERQPNILTPSTVPPPPPCIDGASLGGGAQQRTPTNAQMTNNRGKSSPLPTPLTVISQQQMEVRQSPVVSTRNSTLPLSPPPLPPPQSKQSLSDCVSASTSSQSNSNLSHCQLDTTGRANLFQQIQQGSILMKVGSSSTDRSPVPTIPPTLLDNIDQSDVENNQCFGEGGIQDIGGLAGSLAKELEERPSFPTPLKVISHQQKEVRQSSAVSTQNSTMPSPLSQSMSDCASASSSSQLDSKSSQLDAAGHANLLQQQTESNQKIDWDSELRAILSLCDQEAVLSWKEVQCCSCSFEKCSKLGEGSYGEVFKAVVDNVYVALKIIPFAVNDEQSTKMVNGDYLKPPKLTYNELLITKELSKLSDELCTDFVGFVTPSFVQIVKSTIVKGQYPHELLMAWDDFKKCKPNLAENVRPNTYADENQHFAIIALSDGGRDLESYKLQNGRESFSIFYQLALSLAIAEDALEFEHRDLHVGNILIDKCPPTAKIGYVYENERIEVISNGVKVSIIDFSLSRMKKNDVIVCINLSEDEALFKQKGVADHGDYQFDVYRLMREENGNQWSDFTPKSNIYWLDYAAKKLFSNRFIRGKRKDELNKLFAQFERVERISDFLSSDHFLSVFSEFRSK